MYRRIVVKLGTSVLTGGARRLDRAHMVEITRQCAALRRQGCEVIVVISGPGCTTDLRRSTAAAYASKLARPPLPTF
jgi:glutamate 5-kinase